VLKKILYYVTDHGKGHATRTIAIIRELERLGIQTIVRNSNSLDLLQKSLPNSKIIPGITDVGPAVKEDGLTIDVNKAKIEMGKWINSLDDFSEKEKNTISKIQPNLIISDISAMPFLASKKMKISSMAISNFSWYDCIDFLPTQDLEKLKNAYDCADFAIQLPLGTKMDNFKEKYQSGMVARIPQRSRNEIRNQIGLKEKEYGVLYAMGGSNQEIICKNEQNVKIITMNSRIKSTEKVFNYSEWIEGQELVLASDLVICKCGYGIISECLTNGIPFLYLSDDNRLELKQVSKELENLGFYNKKTFNEINNIEFNQNFLESINKPKKQNVDNAKVANYISEIIER